jgi:hypothetical protein
MFLFDPLNAADVSKHVNENVSQLSKVIWQILATVVTIGVPTVFKWVQDHSRTRRRIELTERVSALSKSIADLPADVPGSASTVHVTPRDALQTELDSVVRELTGLQAKAPHRLGGIAGATASIRSMFLLYKPEGGVAWTLHFAFFSYAGVLFFLFMAVMTDSTASPFNKTKTASDFFTDLVAYMFLVAIFSIPAFTLRYFAAKIHRRQCAQALGATNAGAAGAVAGSAPVGA